MSASDQHWLLHRVAAHGVRIFLHTAAESWSYAELARAVDAEKSRLRAAGIVAGDVAAIASDYSFPAIAVLLALAAERAVVVPLVTTVPAEVDERLAIARATHVWRPTSGWVRREAGLGEPHALISGLREGGRAGLILFSSGSTGRPKAMVHDLDRLLAPHAERRPRALVLLVFLMFDHIGGLNTLFTALATGATVVIPATREPDDVAALIARHRAAVLPASPTFLNLLLMSGARERHDLSSLRIISYGTEPMPDALLARLRAAFPGARFIQTFGTSETGITQTTSKSSDSTLLKLDDPALEHRIVDGELWLRSRTQILGYLNHPMHAFTEDGWFRTGDLVEAGSDGYLRISGRRAELINVGGEKVLPAEVESVLLDLPEITDCLVRGEAHPITGQIVTAQVVLAPGTDPATIRQRVRRHCRERLAAYKVPVKVQVVARTAFGDRFKKLRVTGRA